MNHASNCGRKYESSLEAKYFTHNVVYGAIVKRTMDPIESAENQPNDCGKKYIIITKPH